MLGGLIDVLTKPIEAHIVEVATRATRDAADAHVRKLITRQVVEYVAPRVAVVGILLVTGASMSLHALLAGPARPRMTLRTLKIPIPVVRSPPKTRRRVRRS